MAVTCPATLFAVGLAWVGERLGVGGWPGTVVGTLIWLGILTVMVRRWVTARSVHRKARQQS